MEPALTLGTKYAAIYAGRRNNVMISDRADPTTAPTDATLSATTKPAVNGRKVVTPQKAAVEYLSDTAKLILPTGLFDLAEDSGSNGYNHARLMYKAVLNLAGLTDPIVEGLTNHQTIEAVATFTGNPMVYASETLFNRTVAGMDATNTDYVFQVTARVGTFEDDGTFNPRLADTEEALAVVTIRWGAAAAEVFYAMEIVEENKAAEDTLAALMTRVVIQEQVADFFSRCSGANMSVLDAGCMIAKADVMRWTDDACQTEQVENRYSSKLSAYTMSVVAALNLGALGGIPRNAWTRAYGLSAGLLPSADSVHGREYVLTDVMPEDSELKVVSDAHPEGEDGEKYQRGCMSLIAAFGLMHLANDHTYKPNDDTLKRKGIALVRACSTALAEGEADDLGSDANLQHTMRTTSHPFGLSSTLGVMNDGKRWGFLAEALAIRDTVVPPPVAKVGVVVSQLNKLFALPIGPKFRKSLGDKHTILVALQRDVVANAQEFSALHKHYGYADQRSLTSSQTEDTEDVMPLASAYAKVFCMTEDDRPCGAALAWCVVNCSNENGALVDMYETSLVNYVEKSTDVCDLVAGRVAAGATTDGN